MKKSYLLSKFRLLFLSVLVGAAAGLGAAAFLAGLEFCTDLRAHHHWLLFTLPLSAMVIFALYRYIGHERAVRGHALILDEIHDPKQVLPFRMAPLAILATLFTHLSGGSAGREGVAVQVAASVSDQLQHLFPVKGEQRKDLLRAGMGAGFAAAIGAPLAGAIFGVEVAPPVAWNPFAWLQSVLASYTAFFVVRVVGIVHSSYPTVEAVEISGRLALWALIAAVMFGLAARFFVFLTHALEELFASAKKYPWAKPLVGSLLLLAAFLLVPASERFAGLGLPLIQDALKNFSSPLDPIQKIFFTSLTLASGFKGGEFVPLVVIGATLGSAIAQLAALSPLFFGALGFAAVFGAAASTPLACTVMIGELFGWKIILPAAPIIYISYCLSGSRGIYPNQRRPQPKYHRLNIIISHLRSLFI